MKPLNNRERNKAFYKVVGFFLLSFILAIFLGFTTMNVGKLSEKRSNAELQRLKSQLKFQEEVFAPNVEETSDMISKIPSVNETGENLEVLNQDIGALLSNTKNQVEDDDSWETEMYKDVILALSNLQLSYNNQIKLMDQMGSSNELNQRLQTTIAERDRLENQVKMLQASGGGGGGSGEADCADCLKELKKAKEDLIFANKTIASMESELAKYKQ